MRIRRIRNNPADGCRGVLTNKRFPSRPPKDSSQSRAAANAQHSQGDQTEHRNRVNGQIDQIPAADIAAVEVRETVWKGAVVHAA